ncbi:PREDICTED: non-specific lipid-transfer protein 2-like [Camelina sativa]|uniref:Non-specific lipid-transfer protein 2-like n=1 Tax=Camelina sativa TaxID=90675 RepID=A0ABM0Z968_CAMSA|nr:PREDICTED: non-specific lipid-transfer protein 2-like [Camelina sativa]
MKIIPLMSIALVLLLTSFPDPTRAYCKEALRLCMGTITNHASATWSKCCERLTTPGPCMCKYIKDPAQKKDARRLAGSCGRSMPINDQSLKKHYKCG